MSFGNNQGGVQINLKLYHVYIQSKTGRDKTTYNEDRIVDTNNK